ncbi:cytidylyltransferase domain-containing protein [Prochlorococcus marinus]|uniref:cytidylyltransferase domain-containing protein n=1 Tax=Prochlorococcus marinus TaxID=1219 RepID=UPI0007B32984|nr:glycosyltransferase family protein [Prochlorococcus marinus]KZR78106.1 3-deoxy-manno-octulosonate cytidylyltransferase [Prochlorococcus marinus str. MIT 1320]
MTTAIIIQARLGSSRLPGKVLLPLGKTTVLGYLVNRIGSSKIINNIKLIVATSNDKRDDTLFNYCQKNSINCFRGDELNVLDRFYKCALQYRISTIIRLTADNPLICTDQLFNLYDTFLSRKADYVFFDQSYPEGICADIFSMKLLQEAWKCATSAEDFEHVTPYMHKNKHSKRIFGVSFEPNCSDLRFTIDTKTDFNVVVKIVNEMESIHGNTSYNMHQIISFLRSRPDIKTLNQHIERNKSYDVFNIFYPE